VNPALLYWQSIGLMNPLSRKENTLLHAHRNGHGKPFDREAAEGLLSLQQQALTRFEKATKSAAPCDWGFTLEDGPFMPLPHLTRMQTLCSLMLLQADVQFARGQVDAALDSIFQVQRAARHLGDGNMLVTALGQYTAESQALAALGRHTLRIDAATRRLYLARIEKLPPLRTVAQALHGERGFSTWAEQQASEVVALMVLQSMAASSNQAPATNADGTTTPAPGPRIIAPAGDPHANLSPEVLDAWLTEVRARYAEAEAALALPWHEAKDAVKAVEARIKAGNPLIQGIFPSLQPARDTQARAETHLTMMKAALQHGPELDAAKAAQYKDSFSGQPLQVRPGPGGGLVISSSQAIRGREVQLILAGPNSEPGEKAPR
jgi:hypothetical protein